MLALSVESGMMARDFAAQLCANLHEDEDGVLQQRLTGPFLGQAAERCEQQVSAGWKVEWF
jgi:hypothetical protein